MKKMLLAVLFSLMLLFLISNACYAESSHFKTIPTTEQIWMDQENGVMYLANGPAMRNPDGTAKVYDPRNSIYTNVVTFSDIEKACMLNATPQGLGQTTLAFFVDPETMNMYYAMTNLWGNSSYNLMVNPDGTAKKYDYATTSYANINSSIQLLLVDSQTNNMFRYEDASLTLLCDDNGKPRYYHRETTRYFPEKLSVSSTLLLDDNGVIYHNFDGFLYSLQNEDGTQILYDFSMYDSGITKINSNDILVDSETNVMYLQGPQNSICMKTVDGLPKTVE